MLHIGILTAIFQLRCQRKRYMTRLSSNLYISLIYFISTISFPVCAHHVDSNNLHVWLWPQGLYRSHALRLSRYIVKFLRRNSLFHVLLSRELQRLLATTSVDELVQRQCEGGKKGRTQIRSLKRGTCCIDGAREKSVAFTGTV